MNSGGWQNWVKLLALGLIWGASFTAVGVAVGDYEPLTLAALRLLIAAVILMPIAIWKRVIPSDRRVWGFAIAAAFLSNALPFALLNWAQLSIPSSVAGVFMAALPLVVLPLSHFLVPDETMSTRKTIGLLIGFAGVLVLIGFEVLAQLGGSGVVLLAQLACLTAAICYGLGSIMMKRAPKSDAIGFGALTMALAAIMALPVGLWVEGVPQLGSWQSTAAVIYLGAVPTALAMIVLLSILQTAGPPFLSLVNYQVPVWAMLFGALFLGEIIPMRLWIALGMILFGVAISQGVFKKIRSAMARPTQ